MSADGHGSAVSSGAAAAGLVTYSTSDTARDVVECDPLQLRFNRLRRNVKYIAGAHRRAVEWPSAMFTLTYRPGQEPDKRDVTDVIKNLRNWLRRKYACKTCRFVWVAELQGGRARAGDKGALHYHLVVWLPPELKRKANHLEARGLKASGVLPKLDKKGWWKHGATERDWCRKSPVSYLAKYLSKIGEALSFPKGLRTYGAGGLDVNQRQDRSFMNLPAWLRTGTTPAHKWRRAQGGGFFSALTGQRVASPWIVAASGGIVRLVKIGGAAHQAIIAAMLDPNKWRPSWQPGQAAPFIPLIPINDACGATLVLGQS